MVELYLHSPICLHGVVLNELSTGTTLPFFKLYLRIEENVANVRKGSDMLYFRRCLILYKRNYQDFHNSSLMYVCMYVCMYVYIHKET
jgi:hypothetical protein